LIAHKEATYAKHKHHKKAQTTTMKDLINKKWIVATESNAPEKQGFPVPPPSPIDWTTLSEGDSNLASAGHPPSGVDTNSMAVHEAVQQQDLSAKELTMARLQQARAKWQAAEEKRNAQEQIRFMTALYENRGISIPVPSYQHQHHQYPVAATASMSHQQQQLQQHAASQQMQATVHIPNNNRSCNQHYHTVVGAVSKSNDIHVISPTAHSYNHDEYRTRQHYGTAVSVVSENSDTYASAVVPEAEPQQEQYYCLPSLEDEERFIHDTVERMLLEEHEQQYQPAADHNLYASHCQYYGEYNHQMEILDRSILADDLGDNDECCNFDWEPLPMDTRDDENTLTENCFQRLMDCFEGSPFDDFDCQNVIW
jgi:hypothetical protein